MSILLTKKKKPFVFTLNFPTVLRIQPVTIGQMIGVSSRFSTEMVSDLGVTHGIEPVAEPFYKRRHLINPEETKKTDRREYIDAVTTIVGQIQERQRQIKELQKEIEDLKTKGAERLSKI